MSVRAVRGAITVRENARDAILGQAERLVREMLARNDADAGDLISIFFTATPDLTAAFPAEAARQMGLTDVALLCAQEIAVQGAMERVIRVLMHLETPRTRSDVQHVYLDGAESLRDDLPR